MDKSQILNYLTFILAIGTIIASVWSIICKSNPLYGIILMVLMLILNHLNKKLKESNVFTVEQETVHVNKKE